MALRLSQPRLLSDLLNQTLAEILLRMWNRNQVRLRGVLELVMTAHASDFLPTDFLQFADEVSALHGSELYLP